MNAEFLWSLVETFCLDVDLSRTMAKMRTFDTDALTKCFCFNLAFQKITRHACTRTPLRLRLMHLNCLPVFDDNKLHTCIAFSLF